MELQDHRTQAMTEFADDLVELCRYFGMFEREHVCCGKVTVPQCVVLQTLLHGTREVGALALSVGRSPSAMTRLLDGLVIRNWIERDRDLQDRRRVTVRLTTEGREEAEHLQRLTVETVDAIINAIEEDKRGQVIESMGLVRQAMEDARKAVQSCCEPTAKGL